MIDPDELSGKMGVIYYRLDKSSTLRSLVPQVGQGASLPPDMVVPGIYVILNMNHNPPNVYVGRSQNIAERFYTRMACVGELGIGADYMDNILVWWGDVFCTDGAIDTYSNFDWRRDNLVDIAVTADFWVDGNKYNAEQVLIRAYLSGSLLQGGCTSTNNMLVRSISSLHGSPLQIYICWCPAGNGYSAYSAGWQVINVLPGTNF